MSLSLQEIFAAPDVATKEVQIPEWNGSVHVRQLSALEGIRLGAQFKALTGTDAEIAEQRLVIALATYLSDPEGKPLASQAEALKLLSKSQQVVERIVTAGSDFNGSNQTEEDAIAKNSTPSRADSSPST